MKRIEHLVATVAATATFAAFATPTVSNVSISWTNDTVVTISYDIDKDAIITIDLMVDGIPLAAERYSSLIGDVARSVKAGNGRFAKWLPYREGFQTDTLTNISATVTAWDYAAPPPIVAVALGEPSCTRFYTSVDRLPGGGLTNDMYKGEWLVMRKIPAAGVTWRMGTPTSELSADSKARTNEWPHNVTFTADYYMAVYECTRAQYSRVYGTTGTTDSWTSGDGDTEFRPIANVRWLDLRGSEDWPTSRNVGGFMAALRVRANNALAFDLPTDAQWEYACRAGGGTALPNGYGERNRLVCWFPGNSDNHSHVVGQLLQNGWNLYDMIGNIREWTLDVYSAPLEAAETDPVGPVRVEGTTVSSALAVERGGSFKSQNDWTYSSKGCWLQRSAHRFGNRRDFRNPDIGFRIASPAVYVPPAE